MKRIKRILSVAFVAILIGVSMCVGVSAADAEDSALTSLISNGTTVISNEQSTVSCALDVIANQNSMAIAGIKGNALNFSADRFACAMNLSSIDSITVTSLPDISCGSLYIGSEGVSVGQRISGSNISLMTYEEAKTGKGKDASFKFTVNDSAYEIVCNVYMIDGVNYSPSVSMASLISLNRETYRNIKVSGVLSAYDPEGDEMTFEIVKYPTNGILVLEDRVLGTYTYTPNESYTGSDSFSYVVRDRYGNYSSSATVTIEVNAQRTATVYSDMIDHELYSHAIAVTENGLMNGTQVGDYFCFEADREVSRAELVVTAMNAIGIKNVPETENTGFADDADINPAMKGYIALAYSKGYISGIKSQGEILFRPNDTVTLSEAAVIVSNMIGYAKPAVTPAFADADSIPSWSSAAIESLYTLGILEFPDKTVGANESVTRGDMAALLNKTMQLINK
ncbi:MAG: S-layer homology domain-containing protein [Clostridia bacterium]|nr:S-layer homology domain-containing protein [Clostridia bacterium]